MSPDLVQHHRGWQSQGRPDGPPWNPLCELTARMVVRDRAEHAARRRPAGAPRGPQTAPPRVETCPTAWPAERRGPDREGHPQSQCRFSLPGKLFSWKKILFLKQLHVFPTVPRLGFSPDSLVSSACASCRLDLCSPLFSNTVALRPEREGRSPPK